MDVHVNCMDDMHDMLAAYEHKVRGSVCVCALTNARVLVSTCMWMRPTLMSCMTCWRHI